LNSNADSLSNFQWIFWPFWEIPSCPCWKYFFLKKISLIVIESQHFIEIQLIIFSKNFIYLIFIKCLFLQSLTSFSCSRMGLWTVSMRLHKLSISCFFLADASDSLIISVMLSNLIINRDRILKFKNSSTVVGNACWNINKFQQKAKMAFLFWRWFQTWSVRESRLERDRLDQESRGISVPESRLIRANVIWREWDFSGAQSWSRLVSIPKSQF
jgi:hypothetical protein